MKILKTICQLCKVYIEFTQSTDWLPTAGITETQHLTSLMNESLRTLLTDNVSVLLSVANEFATVMHESYEFGIFKYNVSTLHSCTIALQKEAGIC